jgi:hypothetical protein
MSLRTAHSIETYQSILSVGAPIYRLPPPHELYIINVSAGIFVREPATTHVSEQRVSLHPEVNSIEAVSQMLRQAVGRKLTAFLTEPIDEEILNQILPSLS